MRDDGSITKSERDWPCGHVGLALEVIGMLASRKGQGGSVLKEVLLKRMIEDVRGQAEPAFGDLLDAFRAERVSGSQIVDTYIPSAARYLGEAWVRDTASFADVTVGVQRLQDLLRQIQGGWAADAADGDSDTSVLMIVPPAEQHTLGAMVAASMLRRHGISVAIRFAPGLSDLTALLANNRFEAALITLGSQDRLEMCAKLVKTLKQLTKGTLKVAVGGAVAEACRNVMVEAGADIVTNDIPTLVSEFRL